MTEPSADGWRVLLVDDDEDDYVLVSAMLSEARGRAITVDWADSYTAGKECLSTHRYHAVLVDYDLGDANGLNLIRETVALGCPAALILYTGRGSYEIDVEAMEAGATMYLPKAEATPLLLERFIRYAIERKTAEINLQHRSRELEAARGEAEAGNRRLLAVFDALPVGLCMVDADGGLETYNHAYENIWKGPLPSTRSVRDYTAYAAWWADTGQSLAPEEWASAQAVQKGETVVGQVLKIHRFDGSYGFVINSAAPIRDAQGSINGSAIAIQDITPIRKIEQALKLREAEYRHLFEAMDEAVALLQILYDESGVPVDYIYLDVNPAYEEVIGVHRSDRIGLKASQVYDTPINLEILGNVATTGIPARIEIYVPQLDRYLHTRAFSTEAGKVGIVFRDITERRRIQASQQQYEQDLQSVADAAPALLAYIDSSYTYRWMNKGFERWFGRRLEEMQGHKVWEILGDDAWDRVRGYMQRVLAGEQIIYEEKLRFPDGNSRWVRGAYTPDLDADGKVQGFMVHVVDIGKRKNADNL